MNKLQKLQKITKIVADTSDISLINNYNVTDVTTNPSLLLHAIKEEKYSHILNKALLKSSNLKKSKKIEEIILNINILFGIEILKKINGKVSIEVDPLLSFDIKKTIEYAKSIIFAFEKKGIDRKRILIKIAGTWEGIKAAEILEKNNINCNITLIFNIMQALAAAQANVYLISPFVGRINDWFIKNKKIKNITQENDQGIKFIKIIFNIFKKKSYKTIIMGASFRNITQIESLAGCDALTISPKFLNELYMDKGNIKSNIKNNINNTKEYGKITEEGFRWNINNDHMSNDNLSSGIRNFFYDTISLKNIINKIL